jgi:outer membrane protein assembly factor BamE
MEVVQGNFVSKEQVEVLKPGMTRTQVRDILGTALVASVFHSNRWDYVFTLRRAGVLTPPRKLTVFFADDLLQRFEGDEMPSEAEFVTQLESSRKLGKIPLLTASPEVLSKFSPSTKVLTPAETKLPSTGALATTYPPLESPAQ